MSADRFCAGRCNISGGRGAWHRDESCDHRRRHFMRPAVRLADREGMSQSIPEHGQYVQQTFAQKGE